MSIPIRIAVRKRTSGPGSPNPLWLLACHYRRRYKSFVRKDIDHLPDAEREAVEHAVRVLRSEFSAALRRRKSSDGKIRRILKIILYGSVARGEPVTDMATGYVSDIDLLVIVSDRELVSMRWWEGARDRLTLDTLEDDEWRLASFIVHDLDDVNNQLHLGRPFFKDICRDGIIAYEFSRRELAKPGNLTPEEISAEAQMHFEQWFPAIEAARWGAEQYIKQGYFKDAAFTLHQACERAYHCVLLTLTLYSPKLHDIEKLRGMAEGIEPRLIAAWPRLHYYERLPFNRIKRAYTEARYSPHYLITAEDLAFAAEHVAKLQAIVKQVCEERLQNPPLSHISAKAP